MVSLHLQLHYEFQNKCQSPQLRPITRTGAHAHVLCCQSQLILKHLKNVLPSQL